MRPLFPLLLLAVMALAPSSPDAMGSATPGEGKTAASARGPDSDGANNGNGGNNGNAAAKPPAAAEAGPHGHRLITVPAGEYTVGGRGHPTNPRRKARLAAYRIADAETTNAQFADFVTATGYKTDAERRGSAHIFRYGLPEWKWLDTPGACWRYPQGPDGPEAVKSLSQHPVTCLSAADAQAYARWAGGRLPTQAEWETAARAGSATDFPWGPEFDPRQANTWDGVTHGRSTKADGWEFSAPVRSFPPNAWGLYDVIGNVFEFVSDLPPGVTEKPDQPLASARGGSWWCSARTCHAFNLLDNGTMAKHGSLPNQGFRMVFDPPAAPDGVPSGP